jgi:hypothetical protein
MLNRDFRDKKYIVSATAPRPFLSLFPKCKLRVAALLKK